MPADLFDELVRVLRPFLSVIVARSVVETSLKRQGLSRRGLGPGDYTPALRRAIEKSVGIYLRDRDQRQACREALGRLSTATGPSPELAAQPREERIRVQSERDIVVARKRARTLATTVGFDSTEQIKIVTAVSEVTRNIFAYAQTGEVTLRVLNNGQQGLEIVASDDGPGIADLEAVLGDDYQSRTGMGLGLKGCSRLMTEFAIDSTPGRGTKVTMRKLLNAPGPAYRRHLPSKARLSGNGKAGTSWR